MIITALMMGGDDNILLFDDTVYGTCRDGRCLKASSMIFSPVIGVNATVNISYSQHTGMLVIGHV